MSIRSPISKNKAPEAYFETLSSIFVTLAKNNNRVYNYYLRIGEKIILARILGQMLSRKIIPSLAHLIAKKRGKSSSQIYIFDSRSSGVKIPESINLLRDKKYQFENFLYTGKDIKALFSFGNGPISFSLCSLKRKLGILWFPDYEKIPYYALAAPALTLIYWQAKELGYQVIHAGAVGNTKEGFIIAGRSGQGKSTITLSCLKSKLFFAGDDYILFDLKTKRKVYSIFNAAKLDQDGLNLFPQLRKCVFNKMALESEKRVLFIYKRFPRKISLKFKTKAIFIPQIIPNLQTPELIKITKPAAIRDIAPSSILQFPGSNQADLTNIASLINKFPCYRICFGRNLALIPILIEKFLKSKFLKDYYK
jgi:hypothetical protein